MTREEAECELYEELGFCFKAQNRALTITHFDPFKIESLTPVNPSSNVHYLLDKAWEKLIEQKIRIAEQLEDR